MNNKIECILSLIIILLLCLALFIVTEINAQFPVFYTPQYAQIYQNYNALRMFFPFAYNLTPYSQAGISNTQLTGDGLSGLPLMIFFPDKLPTESFQTVNPAVQGQSGYRTDSSGYQQNQLTQSSNPFTALNVYNNRAVNPFFPSVLFTPDPVLQTGVSPSVNLQPFGYNPLLSNASGQRYTSNQQTSSSAFYNAGQALQNYPYTSFNNNYTTLTNTVRPISFPSQLYPAVNTYYTAGIYGSGSGYGDIRTVAIPTAQLVLANPEYGMYCYDPLQWLDAGFNVGIWLTTIPIRAQSLDKKGSLVDSTPTFTVNPTGETGTMTILDSLLSLYRGLIKADGPADYFVTVKVNTVSTVALAKRRYSTCDSCHPTPPGHIAVGLTWGNCHECHNLGNVLHRHAYQAGIAIDNCYKCHPSGCLSGAHGQLDIWCTDCHGSLLDAAYGTMLISGQLGKPQCADCHDAAHSEPGTTLFVDSAGHGGVWCINCHGATHVELSLPIGLNNCAKCHTVQANIPWMGPNCALCHGSSYSPHLVTR